MGDVAFTRKRLLSAGAVSASALLLRAQSVRGETADDVQAGARIDIHGHAITPSIEGALADRGHRRFEGRDLPTWSVEEARSYLDRQGIDLQVLSTPDPGLTLVPVESHVSMARAINDEFASVVARGGGRFAWFAVLPLRAGVHAAIAECRRAMGAGASGVILPTTVDRRQLGHRAFLPLLAELSRRRVAAMVHPVAPAGPEMWPEQDPSTADTLEHAFASVRCAASLLYGGAFVRAPHLRLLFGGGGGGLPFMASRVALPDQAFGRDVLVRPLRDLWFDTANASGPGAMRTARSFVHSPTQLLYGSDWPLTPERSVAEALSHVPANEMDIVVGGAALARFPALAARAEDLR